MVCQTKSQTPLNRTHQKRLQTQTFGHHWELKDPRLALAKYADVDKNDHQPAGRSDHGGQPV